MKTDELLAADRPPETIELDDGELARLFWKYKGLQKRWERANAFWGATNDNLKIAYEQLDEKDRLLEQAYMTIQEDLEVASRIQRALLPEPSPELLAQLEVGVYHNQLSEVGGDYYDFFRLKGGSTAIGVFDISGHGVSAALVMTYLKAQFMQLMDHVDSPGELVGRVNSSSFSFLRHVKKYATVNFVAFEPDRVRYACGGGFGVLFSGGETHTFNKRDHFLGLRNRPFREFELPLRAGDLLALYTDGIVESQDARGEDYSVRRLNELILDNRARAVEDIVEACVDDYLRFRERDTDDITLLILRKK
ncbi:MAG: SpoIIE family protein phosphatase [Myxococcales bacterium]|nr:SpoIIE family protein phosphatase [Myxococcales bacterium]MCB9749599.1 SpoIIE family protein phosphatase [Myxococcales bacterium]